MNYIATHTYPPPALAAAEAPVAAPAAGARGGRPGIGRRGASAADPGGMGARVLAVHSDLNISNGDIYGFSSGTARNS